LNPSGPDRANVDAATFFAIVGAASAVLLTYT
jgi:hypothetical protein